MGILISYFITGASTIVEKWGTKLDFQKVGEQNCCAFGLEAHQFLRNYLIYSAYNSCFNKAHFIYSLTQIHNSVLLHKSATTL